MNLREFIKHQLKNKLNEGGGRLTMKDIEEMVRKNNEEHGTVFEVSGAYGFVELWANGQRLDAGTPKDIRNTFIKLRFNDKYRDPNWVKPQEQQAGTGTPETQSANLKAIGGAFGIDLTKENALNEMETVDYLEDAKQGIEVFNQKAAIEFPNKLVSAKAQSFMSVESSSIVVTGADIAPEDAGERLKFLNSPHMRFMMHLTDNFGRQLPMDKFSFEVLNIDHKLSAKAVQMGKPLKYRKITGKTPSEALQKMMAWLILNKEVLY